MSFKPFTKQFRTPPLEEKTRLKLIDGLESLPRELKERSKILIEKLNLKFSELMKKYHDQIGKKANRGLTITNQFKKWIEENPSVRKKEKQQMLDHCNHLNETIKKAVEGQIIFTDKSAENITKYLEKNFDISIKKNTILLFARRNLPLKDYKERFRSFPLHPEDVNEIIKELTHTTILSPYQIREEVKNETNIDVSIQRIRRIALKELTREEYLERFPKEFYQRLGEVTQVVLEDIVCEAMQEKGISVLSEAVINEEGKISDNLILIDNKFNEVYPTRFSPNIRNIAVDYSLDTTQGNFTTKCNRNYQSEDTTFIFVPISYQKSVSDYEIPPVPFKDNIRVLSIKDFINFFNFSEKYYNLSVNFINEVFEVRKTRDLGAIKQLLEYFEKMDSVKEGQKLITEF
ncbi:MAG: hypothetical protein ACFFD2_06975 [Promethearchaeota archaeon]